MRCILVFNYEYNSWFCEVWKYNSVSLYSDRMIINSDIDQTTPKEKLAEINKYGFSGAISSFDIDSTILETDIYQSSKIIAAAIVVYANS